MNIRKAIPSDAPDIAPLIMLAMHDIFYRFVQDQTENYEKAVRVLTQLVHSNNNQYSYDNCTVYVLQNKVAGLLLVYNGSEIKKLRELVAEMILQEYGVLFLPEDETEAGEYYIDCIAVSESYQGKGIGSALLNYAINEYVNRRKHLIGLLVDVENPNAKKLYIAKGFQVKGIKTLTGKPMEHLQMHPF